VKLLVTIFVVVLLCVLLVNLFLLIRIIRRMHTFVLVDYGEYYGLSYLQMQVDCV